MKIFKKILYAFLAIIPILSVIMGMLATYRGTTDYTDRPIGNITFTVDGSTYTAHTEDGTWISTICPNIDGQTGNSTHTNFILYRLTMAITNYANNNTIKFPRVYELDDSYIDGKVYLIAHVFIYEIIVGIITMLTSLVTWIPRKITEVFQ